MGFISDSKFKRTVRKPDGWIPPALNTPQGVHPPFVNVDRNDMNFPYLTEDPVWVLNQTRYWRLNDSQVVDLKNTDFTARYAKIGNHLPVRQHVRAVLERGAVEIYSIVYWQNRFKQLYTQSDYSVPGDSYPYQKAESRKWIKTTPLYKSLVTTTRRVTIEVPEDLDVEQLAKSIRIVHD